MVTPVELMNTVWADRHAVHDSLAARYGAELAEDGLADLRELRDALRRLAAARTGDPRERAASALGDLSTAVHVVNKHAKAYWALDLADDGTLARELRVPGGPAERLLATVATQAVELFTGGADLRACLGPGCVRYFVKDHPRREWCSAGCGNRARAARHYARHGRD